MQKFYLTIECKYMPYKLGMWRRRGKEEKEEEEKCYQIRPIQVASHCLKAMKLSITVKLLPYVKNTYFLFFDAGIEPMALPVLNPCSTTELHPQLHTEQARYW